MIFKLDYWAQIVAMPASDWSEIPPQEIAKMRQLQASWEKTVEAKSKSTLRQTEYKVQRQAPPPPPIKGMFAPRINPPSYSSPFPTPLLV